ncbi:MAG: serine hydrolase [Clostridia bacterium]
MKGLLDEFIAGQSGTYGIAFINLVTGETFGINDTEEYIAASTSKLVINLLLFERIAKGAIDPQTILTYEEVDFEPGAGIIQREEYGTEYTVLETARLSIIHSDNCAINMIIRLLGNNQVVQYMLDLGGSINYRGYRSSPRDMAIYTRHLYHFYLEEPEVAGILMKYLESTPFNDRIRKWLPEDVRVAHKIGNFDRTANDVGIVFASEPYVISMMSDDVDFLEGCKVLAQMSKMVYDFMEKDMALAQ